VYRPVLGFGMRWRWLVTSVAVFALLCSGVVGSFLGAEFVPKLDEGAVAIQIIRPPSVSLEEAVVQAGSVERSLLARFPAEIPHRVSKTGRAEIATDPMGVDFSDLIVMLTRPRTGRRPTTRRAWSPRWRRACARTSPA
jgi:cobalt-zinc-cadmium resistance protein CzcA